MNFEVRKISKSHKTKIDCRQIGACPILSVTQVNLNCIVTDDDFVLNVTFFPSTDFWPAIGLYAVCVKRRYVRQLQAATSLLLPDLMRIRPSSADITVNFASESQTQMSRSLGSFYRVAVP